MAKIFLNVIIFCKIINVLSFFIEGQMFFFYCVCALREIMKKIFSVNTIYLCNGFILVQAANIFLTSFDLFEVFILVTLFET